MQSRRQFVAALAVLGVAGGVSGCWARRGSAGVLESIDALMRRFVRDEVLSAGQIAVFRGGVEVFSRAYGDAPPTGYRALSPKTLFRIASCSKMFTCAAIDALHRRGKVDLNARVFRLLGIHEPALAGDRPDPRIDDITVQHLVDHAGGWNIHRPIQIPGGPFIDAVHWDPMFRMRQVANDLGLAVPPTKMQLARYMYGKPLQFTPGTQDYKTTRGNSYSNFGYVLLGMVVEAVTGGRYIDYVRDGIDGKGAWPEVLVSPMLSGEKNLLEVWYDEPKVGLSALQPQSEVELPFTSGGGGFITELMDSAGGLMTNAETLARFASRHAAFGMGGRAAGSERDGGMAGLSSEVMSRPNGVDCAFIFNRTEFGDEGRTLDVFLGLLKTMLDAL